MHHSCSANPINPIFRPLDDSIIAVFKQSPRGTSVPWPGSNTLASSQGKLHRLFKWMNWVTPKSRSWFCRSYSSVHKSNRQGHSNTKQLTPMQAIAVGRLLRISSICFPLVTELSRLGLKASPENSEMRSGWPLYSRPSRYWLTKYWNLG